MPVNSQSVFDQIAPLVQQQQDFYKQQEDLYRQRQAMIDAQLSPYANVDPVNQAYVGGLLAPTKSGSFFESLGNAVDASSGVLSKLRESQMNQQDKIASLKAAQIKLALELPYQQARLQRYLSNGAAGDTIEQKRLLLSAQLKRLEDKNWDEAKNYDTGEPFASEEEFNAYKDSIDAALFSLNREARGVAAKGATKTEPASGQAGIPKITDDAAGEQAWKNLPPGSDYIDPSGVLRRKPSSGEKG